jgi:hypothetical protein
MLFIDFKVVRTTIFIMRIFPNKNGIRIKLEICLHNKHIPNGLDSLLHEMIIAPEAKF